MLGIQQGFPEGIFGGRRKRTVIYGGYTMCQVLSKLHFPLGCHNYSAWTLSPHPLHRQGCSPDRSSLIQPVRAELGYSPMHDSRKACEQSQRLSCLGQPPEVRWQQREAGVGWGGCCVCVQLWSTHERKEAQAQGSFCLKLSVLSHLTLHPLSLEGSSEAFLGS